jgi:hypothetical protein
MAAQEIPISRRRNARALLVMAQLAFSAPDFEIPQRADTLRFSLFGSTDCGDSRKPW